MSTGLQTAAAVKPVVVKVGGAFMTSDEVKAASKEGGYRGWAFYMTGRAGVLGDVPVEVVEATIGFFDPGLVRFGWETGRKVAPLPETVARYVEVCREWGRHHLDLPEVDRLADLLESVVSAADASGWPLFAAWREQSLPDDPPARVAQLLQVLREHRGGAHLGAVRVCGLRPLEAVVLGEEGADGARFFGWRGELPVPGERAAAALARAEGLTDEQVAPAYDVLDAAEQDDLVRLLGTLAAMGAR